MGLYSFQLLAPAKSGIAQNFSNPTNNEHLYGHFLSEMQKLRGSIYLKDGAIKSWELDDDGRYRMQGDEQSWHLLLLDEEKSVIGCARYLVHTGDVSYDRLRISHSPLAGCPDWGSKVRSAVEEDLRRVRDARINYVEVGGWALSEQWRGTRAALEILVGSYALGQLWGGCIGSCTATVRHSSSSMLRRLGGQSFELAGECLPSYNDPEYECVMELLRFDYRSPAPRFLPLIHQLKSVLSKAPVATPAEPFSVRLREFIPEHAGRLRLTPVFIS
jgi:predicted GNAT family N-acyltransferase